MPKLIITKGLPGAGKSVWSKKYQEENPNTVRVNKDELRSMLHNSVHSKGREAFILKLRDRIVIDSLHDGHDVIVDDTNFNPIHESTLREYALKLGVSFEVKDFTDVPLDQCIKNDLKRYNSVGEKVIKTMYNQYLKQNVTPVEVEYDPNLPCALISDLDGTMCLFGDKNPYNRDFENDLINGAVSESLRLLRDRFDAEVILCSGRDEKFRTVTEQWLKNHVVKYDYLFMRKSGDTRKDSIIKKEIYDNNIKGKFNVYLVFDDRNSVVTLWRSLGLTVFQVNDGDF